MPTALLEGTARGPRPDHRGDPASWPSPVSRRSDPGRERRQRVIGLFPDWYAAVQPDWPRQTSRTGFPPCDAGEAAPPWHRATIGPAMARDRRMG